MISPTSNTKFLALRASVIAINPSASLDIKINHHGVGENLTRSFTVVLDDENSWTNDTFATALADATTGVANYLVDYVAEQANRLADDYAASVYYSNEAKKLLQDKANDLADEYAAMSADVAEAA